MSEVSHHASALALYHVQGLGVGSQDIKAPISAKTSGSHKKKKKKKQVLNVNTGHSLI